MRRGHAAIVAAGVQPRHPTHAPVQRQCGNAQSNTTTMSTSTAALRGSDATPMVERAG